MQRKYLTIYNDLVKKIQANVWPVSTKLPSENKLAIQYDTSRETIRKSLDLLSHNGFIQKNQGRGSIVINMHKFSFPVSGIESYTELADKLHLNSQTLVNTIKTLDSDHDIAKLLTSDPKETIWHVVRMRKVDEEKIILDKDYFNEKYVPKLSKEICEQSIYNYIENELGLTIGFAQKEIVVEPPTEEDRALLDLEGFSSLAVIRSHVYLDDANLFQYSESRHRPDKFRFVDFARRVKD